MTHTPAVQARAAELLAHNLATGAVRVTDTDAAEGYFLALAAWRDGLKNAR